MRSHLLRIRSVKRRDTSRLRLSSKTKLKISTRSASASGRNSTARRFIVTGPLRSGEQGSKFRIDLFESQIGPGIVDRLLNAGADCFQSLGMLEAVALPEADRILNGFAG